MADDWVAGADVGGTNVKFAVSDAAGRVLARGDVPTDPAAPLDTIQRLAAALRAVLPGDHKRLTAVGLACAGIVAPATGRLGRSPNLPGWQGSDLGGALRAAFGNIVTAVANDVNAALYGEYRHGAGRGCRDLVMIALGTGVGGGVLIDGKLVTGFADGAGEIGHMTLELEGPLCPCGNRGCLESYCGSVGLLARARQLAAAPEASAAWCELIRSQGEALTTSACHELAAAGDPTARALFAAAGRRLGQAVASLINVLAPERVIIGGGVAQAGEFFLVPCRDMVASHVMNDEARDTPVVPAELGPYAAATGAAALAREAGAVP
ncbi:MAG: ROK family protein [Candidatus Krumholzibacteria bacterium]|nr:ROK family protein [Candidatus Krumholzibacteria bacterium]